MALNMKNLTAPGDVNAVDGARIAGSLGGSGGHMPTWGVGDPVATAVAGFQKGMERFKEHYDKSKADEFLINKKMELDKLYFDKDNGLFNTRKGEAAQGLYQEGVQYMRDMWDKDAQDNLSEQQRDLVSKGMTELFKDYSHKIAKYETDEMINGTKARIETNLYNCQNMVVTGDFTEEDLGLALHGIRNGVESLGKLQGLDAETIKMNQEKEVGSMLTKAATSLAATRPEAAIGMLKSYKGMIPEMMYAPCMKTLTKHADAEAKRRSNMRTQGEMSAMLANLDDANAEDVLALAQEKYPNDLAKQTKFMGQWNSRQNALSRVQKQKDKIALMQFGEAVKTQVMGLPLEQRADAAENMIAAMPNEKMQEQARKIYYNYEKALNPETGNSVKMDHPAFLQQASERIANGETFDVAAEYGDRLTPATVKKLSDKGEQALVKRASKSFHAGAMQYIGGDKKRKQEVVGKFGSTSQANLWQQFYEELPDSVKENPKELEAYAKNFWKTTVLEKPAWFGLSSKQKTMPMGLANEFIDENADDSWQVARGQSGRDVATKVLNKKGQKYSDENYSRVTPDIIDAQLRGEIE